MVLKQPVLPTAVNQLVLSMTLSFIPDIGTKYGPQYHTRNWILSGNADSSFLFVNNDSFQTVFEIAEIMTFGQTVAVTSFFSCELIFACFVSSFFHIICWTLCLIKYQIKDIPIVCFCLCGITHYFCSLVMNKEMYLGAISLSCGVFALI